MPPRKRSKMRFPLPPVTDVEGRRCVCIEIPDEPTHIENFWGHLWSLGQWFNWEKSEGRHAKEVADVWREIWEIAHDKFNRDECCGDGADEPTCQDYPANSGIIEYRPSDPFLTPDYIPPPWMKHPFLVGESDFLPGSMDGDVTFSYRNFFDNFLEFALWAVTHFPSWVWDGLGDLGDWLDDVELNLFPRFKIRFEGAGQVDLHLLKVPAGGLAYVTLDGNPQGVFTPLTTFSVIEIESWLDGLLTIGLGSMAGKFVQTEIIQVVVENPGQHYIDVTFIPKIEVSFPDFVAVGWGGGLRKIELCGVKPIVPVPPTRENEAENCIEWLNPTTRIWECIAKIEPSVVCPDCGDELEECEGCMGCSKCEANLVRFCEGKLQYKNDSGQWVNLPQTALPDDSVPPPPPDEVPSGAIACFKANGVWSAIERTIDALFEAYDDAGGLLAGVSWFYEVQKSHPEVKLDNAKLFNFCSIQISDVEAGEGALWIAAKTDLHDMFVCAMQDTYTKSSELSDAEIATAKAFEWDSGDDALDGFLSAAMILPESSWFKLMAHNAVADELGTCPCDGSEVLPEIPVGATVIVSDMVTAQTSVYSVNMQLQQVKASSPDGAKEGSKWSFRRYYDAGEEVTHYHCGILLEIKPSAITINNFQARIETQSGAGYVNITLWKLAGSSPTAVFENQSNTPDDSTTSPVPSGGVTLNSGTMGTTHSYLLIGALANYDGNVTKTVKLSGIVLDVTIGGERFNYVIPDVAIYTS